MEPGAALPDAQIVGVGGEIAVVRYANPVDEAIGVAAGVGVWLSSGVQPSEIAVLVTRQVDLYGGALKAELDARGITYRDDHELQEFVNQPIAVAVIDVVSCIAQSAAPDSYGRLLDLIDAQDYSETQAYRLRSDFNAFVDRRRSMLADAPALATDVAFVADLINEFVANFPLTLLTSLSPDYEQGTRLQDLIDEVKEYFRERLSAGANVCSALRQLSGDQSIKIMTVHKSKGLEFRKVVMMAIEHETYFGAPAEERSNFFVGISRAKETLILTYVDQRPRPPGAKRWSVIRNGHAEFLGYARPYVGS
jgi:superfamily I DNA/RNA helicase